MINNKHKSTVSCQLPARSSGGSDVSCQLSVVQSKASGFTLIELIIYVLIFTIVGVAAGETLSLALRNRADAARLGAVHTNAQEIAQRIVERVQAADGVTTASGSNMELQMSAAAENPTTFSLSGGKLFIQRGTDPAAQASDDSVFISALSFAKVQNASPARATALIEISVGLRTPGGGLDESFVYSLRTVAMNEG